MNLRIKPFYIFVYDNVSVLINIEDMCVFTVDHTVAKFLGLIKGQSEYEFSDKENVILERYKLVDNVKTKPTKSKRPQAVPISSIVLFITQDCNLDCIYCYGDSGGYGSSGNMNHNTAFRSIDWLIEKSESKNKLAISFFGGEPLLNFELVKDSVYYALKRGKETGKKFDFRLTTNATLLDDEKITFLKHHEIVPLVSFDGPKELQDAQRPFKNGKGSYDLVLPKIQRLLKAIPKSECRATLIGDTEPTYVNAFLHEIGFTATSLLVASRSLFERNNCSYCSEGAFAGMLKKVDVEADNLLRAIKTQDLVELTKLRRSGLLLGSLEAFINSQKRLFPCGAGRASVAVSNAGDVYLCHRFVGSAPYKLGSIFDKDVERDIYQISSLNHDNKCVTCFAKYICAGGCYHDNLGKTGSIWKPNEDMCNPIRYSVQVAAGLSSKLNSRDKRHLVKSGIISKKTCPFDLF